MLHPEVTEFVGLPEFTHWLLIPESDRHHAFIKAVILDEHTNRDNLKSKGIKVYPITNPPPLPKRPIYK